MNYKQEHPVFNCLVRILFWNGFILSLCVIPLAWAQLPPGGGQCEKKITFTLKLDDPSQGSVSPTQVKICPGERASFTASCNRGVQGPVKVTITADNGSPPVVVNVPCKLKKCEDLGPGWEEAKCISGQCEEPNQIQIPPGQIRTCYKCSDPNPPAGNCGCTEGVATQSTNDTEHCGGGCVDATSQRTCPYECPVGSSWAGGVAPTSPTIYCCKCRKPITDQCQPPSNELTPEECSLRNVAGAIQDGKYVKQGGVDDCGNCCNDKFVLDTNACKI